MRTQEQMNQGRPRTVTVSLPSRYVLRASKANQVVWILLTPLALFLSGACLMRTLAADGGFLRPGRFSGGERLLAILFAFLILLLFAALMLVCPLLAVKNRKDSLTVDGEQLVLRRWLRKPLSFSFAGIACVQTRQGQETVALQGRNGQTLCRLPAVMEHMDLFQADLRSRRIPFVRRGEPVPDAFPLSPGPRQETITLVLPDAVPECYLLTNPPAFAVIFTALLVFCLFFMLAFGLIQREPAVLCLLPFVLLAAVGLVWVRQERVEILGSRLRRRDPRGRVTEFTFSDAAAVRIQTIATGIGPVSSLQLLNASGTPLLRPGSYLRGTEFLLADLIDRGIPFTY